MLLFLVHGFFLQNYLFDNLSRWQCRQNECSSPPEDNTKVLVQYVEVSEAFSMPRISISMEENVPRLEVNVTAFTTIDNELVLDYGLD